MSVPRLLEKLVLLTVTLLLVASAPALAQDCSLTSGAFCPPDEYCKSPEGMCDADGFCTAIPQGCGAVWDPVCGCDDVTYSNECVLEAAQRSVRSRGECPQLCGGSSGLTCPEGQFCETETGQCDSEGLCQPRPNGCDTVYDPVCGCDGNTYGNGCEANAAGVSVAHPGPCQPVCGGIVGLLCVPNEFCKLPDGRCCCDFAGTCEPIPSQCDASCRPVCGCDGLSYRNECEASSAGVSLERRGVCREVPDVHFTAADRLHWGSTAGAILFHVYRAHVDPASGTRSVDCYLAAVQGASADVPGTPPPGGAWGFLVTAGYPEGEGPLGASSRCSPRTLPVSCSGN